MKIELEHGTLEISNEALTSIIGSAAMGCFGVRGMAPVSMGDGLVKLLKKEHLSHGVKATEHEDGTMSAELHIVVKHGINIAAVCASIIEQVRYSVENMTGIHVSGIDVKVDSIMPD